MADYVQAQMDLGATLCTRREPACSSCPIATDCVASQTGRTAELPTPKPGKPLPERSTLVLFAMDAKSRILMQRRPAAGVWQGLWSLPEAQDLEAARHWFGTHLAGSFETAETLATIAHGFSHYRLLMRPLRWTGVAAATRVNDNDGLRWVDRSQLASLGIPAPIRTLIEAK